MSPVVTTKLVRIGNSRGIRLPKVLVEQAGLAEELELEVRQKQLVVRSRRRRPREGWEERFRDMAAQGADRTLWPETPLSSFDEAEWEW